MNKSELVARMALIYRDKELAQTCADELSVFGFVIRSVTQRGVMFSGKTTLFEKFFNAKVEITEDGTSFLTTPVFPVLLREMVDSVYFPTKPIFIKEGGHHGKRD